MKCTRRSPLARVRLRLRTRACGDVRTGGPHRAASLARVYRCPPVAPRRRPRASAAVPSPAAVGARGCPRACAAVCALAAVAACRRPGAGAAVPSPAAVAARGCLCAGAAVPSPAAFRARGCPRACAGVCSLAAVAACRRPGAGAEVPSPAAVAARGWAARSSVCTEKDISVGKKKPRRGIKKNLSLSPSCCYMSLSTKQYTVATLLSVRGGGGRRVRLATLVKAAGCIQLLAESRRSGALLRGLRLAATLVVASPLPRAGGAAGDFASAARAVAAAVSAATRAAGGSSPGGALAPAAEPEAGGADDDASAARVVTAMAATPSPTSTTWIFLAALRAGGAGVGARAGGAARPAAGIILSITSCRYCAASGV